MIKGTGEVIVFDIKSIDPRKNRRALPSKEHVWQVMQNIDLVAECLGLRPSKGVLLYVDCSNYQDMLEVEIEIDQEILDTLYERASMILNAKDAEEIPPEGVYEGTCGYCTFKDHCNAAQAKAQELKEQQKLQEKVAKNVFG